MVAFSSGNHAQAVALAAAEAGVDAVIVMPVDAPRAKREATVAYGARVVDYDRMTDDREEFARRIVEEEGRVLVPPYDDPLVMAGQGTAALELLEDVPDLTYEELAGEPGKVDRLRQAFLSSRFADRTPLYSERPFLLRFGTFTVGGRIDAVFGELPVILGRGTLAGRRSVAFDALLDTAPGDSLARAHAAVGPDTVAKFLFTSGSTKLPKAVPNTQRMLTANQQMLRQCMRFLADAPPVLVDWLPWNHTFGGNHNVGLTIYNGGTLYIDEGKPVPALIGETLRNLREIAPTVYFNVPKGFEEIAAAMEHDSVLRERLFSRVKAFMYAGAGLSQAVWDRLGSLAEATVGERIPILTGLGMTETAPSCTFAVRYATLRSGHIGLPCPGVEVKLVPEGDGPLDKTEIRFRGPNVMPGYWREPGLTAEAFDDEGYYHTGDAVRWVDAADPLHGLLFDGRLAEDFKLDTGTFVSVGPLRGSWENGWALDCRARPWSVVLPKRGSGGRI